MVEDVNVFVGFLVFENLLQFEVDFRFQVFVGLIEGEIILLINNKLLLFDNVKVCEVIVYVIDWQVIIDGVMFGIGMLIGIYFVLYNLDYVDLIVNSQYDLDLLKKFLVEVGFLDGFIMILKLLLLFYVWCGGEIIVVQLWVVGIEIEIINLEWVQWLEQVFKGKDYGLIIVSYMELMDIGIYVWLDYYFQYDNLVFQKFFEDLIVEVDFEKCFEFLR